MMFVFGIEVRPSGFEIGVTITLALTEAQFLLTVLKASSEILTALVGMQKSLPDFSPLPITTDAITEIAVLAETIRQQVPN